MEAATIRYRLRSRILWTILPCAIVGLSAYSLISPGIQSLSAWSVRILMLGILTVMLFTEPLRVFNCIDWTNQSLTSRGLFKRPRRMTISAIQSVKYHYLRKRLELISPSEHLSLCLDQEIPGFNTLFRDLRKLRPDLWQPNPFAEFRVYKSVVVQFFLLEIVAFVIALLAVFVVPNTLVASICFAIGVLGFVNTGLDRVEAFHISGGQLMLKSLLRRRVISLLEIQDVSFDSSRNSFSDCVRLTLSDKKSIILFGFREGAAVVYDAISSAVQSVKAKA